MLSTQRNKTKNKIQCHHIIPLLENLQAHPCLLENHICTAWPIQSVFHLQLTVQNLASTLCPGLLPQRASYHCDFQNAILFLSMEYLCLTS